MSPSLRLRRTRNLDPGGVRVVKGQPADGPTPKVSVVVATYSPGDGINRLIDSLDLQTMPQRDFEVVLVDDGSPDDTVQRLERLAATRPNVRIYRIDNSGWPSRPRNVGVDYARGEYVFFMDHDDALYPDGLRRSYEFALENNADVVNIQEYNTKHVWWMQKLPKNIPNAITEGGIEQLMPFMPHKLYRRDLIVDNEIKFPERPRALWEDWYINVAAYRHSQVVSVLADTPVYLRYIHGANTSNTFSPSRPDYWERLEEVLRYIDTTLDGPDYRAARTLAIARHVILRLLAPLGKLAITADARTVKATFGAAAQMLADYYDDDVAARLSKTHRSMVHLLQADRPDLVGQLHTADQLFKARTEAGNLRWRDGRLVADLRCVWESNSTEPVFRRDGERLVRVLTPELHQELPADLVEITDDARGLSLNVRLRNRRDFVSYDVGATFREKAFVEDAEGNLQLVGRGECAFTPDTVAYGSPITRDVWDLRTRTTWRGLGREGNLLYSGGPRPLMNHRRPVVAYSNNSRALSVDLEQQLRTFAVDAMPKGPAGPITGFSIALENAAAAGELGEMDALVYAVSMERIEGLDAQGLKDRIEALAADGDLSIRVVADESGLRLEGGGELPAGRYRMFSRLAGQLKSTKLTLTVDEAGQASFERLES